jgi:hypothetical protein
MRYRLLQVFGWVTLGACTFVNGALLLQTVRLPFLTGGGAAQADLGLFMATIIFGGPVVIVSLALVAIARRMSRMAGCGSTTPFGYRAFILVGFTNIVVPLAVLAWVSV